jgi:HTH-type transcriptional regulator/antitoxin HigA
MKLTKHYTPSQSCTSGIDATFTHDEYSRLVTLLDNLTDEVGEDESHPLASLMEVLGVLVEKYEAEHVPELTVD